MELRAKGTIWRERIFADIGICLQATAVLELTLDDLLGLTNARLNAAKLISEKYPVNLTDKIACVPKLAEAVDFDLKYDFASRQVQALIELRHCLSHGRIVAIRPVSDSYEFTVAKMGRPRKDSGIQRLTRKPQSFRFDDLLAAVHALDEMQQVLEAMRRVVFRAGDGWPSYLVYSEDDPLMLLTPSKAMLRHD
jgi:hypothetical protein